MTSARPHVLYVAWGFPPCRSGGVYRALATANAFAGTCDVTVLTVERACFERYTGTDPTLEALVDPSVTIRRTAFDWPALDTDISSYSRWRVYLPRAWGRLRKRLDRVAFPEVGYGPWRRDLERAARAVHAEHPVDLVVATANPATAFTAAHALHGEGVPYVLDYRDAWSLDVFSGDRVHSARSRVGRWERKLIEHAREIWFVNSAIQGWHCHAYPAAADRMHVVENGWDPQFAPTGEYRPTSTDLVFGYVGTVSPKVPLSQTIDGWRMARETDNQLANARMDVRGYLGYYSRPQPQLLALISDAASDGVAYGGPVAKTDVRNVYTSFDVLLLILGSGRYVTSGKVYEYLASGLPIVSIHEPSNAASDVLRGYPLWFPTASLDRDDIAAALRAAAACARGLTPQRQAEARAFAEKFRRDRALQPRVSALIESIGRVDAGVSDGASA